MPVPRVVVASTGFPALPQNLREALPEIDLSMIDAPALRRGGAEADVLIPTMAQIDASLMDRIHGLRLIQQWGVGLEGVDIPAATSRNILVARVASAGTGNAESVAEWCIMAAIAVDRHLPELERGIRSGSPWGAPQGRALLGRSAGILGMGGIGRALAERLRPFGMRVAGISRRDDPALAARLGMEWIHGMDSLHELLRRSDHLFLCLPVTGETQGLIGREELSLLPDGACLVNPARGGLVDHAALLAELETGRLSGAGLDVFEREPLDPTSPLLARSDVIATPHIAGVTGVSYRGIALGVAANIRRVMAGEEPVDCVNCREIRKKVNSCQ